MQARIIFIFVAALIVGTQADFLPERLRVIDNYKNNFLVRGNLPIKNKQFQINQLREEITVLTKQKSFNLIIISLLNFLTAKQTINNYIQEKFFQNNPNQGKFIRKIVLGSLINPSSVPPVLRKFYNAIDKFVGIDDMDNFIKQIRSFLLNSSQSTIIYVHCSAGVDRTGYVSGAYGIKYKNMMLTEVVKQNLEILKGFREHMHFNTLNGLKWYCLSLGHKDSDCDV